MAFANGIVVDDVLVFSGSVVAECRHASNVDAQRLADLAKSGKLCVSTLVGGTVCANLQATVPTAERTPDTTTTAESVAVTKASKQNSSTSQGGSFVAIVGAAVGALFLMVIALTIVIIRMKKRINRRRSVVPGTLEEADQSPSQRPTPSTGLYSGGDNMVLNPRMFTGATKTQSASATAETSFADGSPDSSDAEATPMPNSPSEYDESHDTPAADGAGQSITLRDLNHAPYVLCGVKYIDLVSLALFSGQPANHKL